MGIRWRVLALDEEPIGWSVHFLELEWQPRVVPTRGPGGGRGLREGSRAVLTPGHVFKAPHHYLWERAEEAGDLPLASA